MSRLGGFALVLGAALALAAPPVALAVPGALDTSFSADGMLTFNFGGLDRAAHVAVTPNGRIVAVGSTDATGAGDYAISRVLPDGTPDSSFDGDGKQTIGTQAGVNDIGGGVVALPDERIIVTGQGNSSSDFVTRRLDTAGGVDGTFGTAGASVVDFGGIDSANDIVRQPDGKLVLVGSTSAVGGGDFAIARLNADGTPDTSFSGDGKATVGFGADDVALGVAIAPGGKIVVAGQGGANNDMLVTRLNENGSLDTTFSPATPGAAYVDFGGTESAGDVAVQPDGKIVLAGSTSAVASGDFAVARLDFSGVLDPAFSGDGKLTLGFAAPNEQGLAVAIQQNGRIVVLGQGDADNDFVLVRLNGDGSTDSTFDGGVVAVDFNGFEYDGDLALQPNGQIVLAGSTNVVDGGDMAIARIDGDPVAIAPPGGGGPGGGLGPVLPPGPTSVVLQPPSGAVVAGRPSSFQVTPNAGSTVDHYNWDLNGDGKPDIQCGAETPILQPSFPGPYSGPITVTAVGLGGAQASATIGVTVGRAPTQVSDLLHSLFGTRINRALLPSGTYSKYLSASCVRPPSLPKIDVTPGGGPPAGCTERIASAGLLSATGCFTRPTKATEIPLSERRTLANLDIKFAQSAAGQRALAAHSSASLVEYALLTVAVSSGVHVTTQAARVNGLDIKPLGNAVLVLEAIHPSFVKDEAYLVSSNAEISIAGVPMSVGPIALKVGYGHDPVRVTQFDTKSVKSLGSALKLNRGISTVDFSAGKTLLGVHVLLPDVFGGITGDATVTLRNPGGADLSRVGIHATGFQIAGIGVKNADLVYQASPLLLTSNIELALGAKGPKLKAYLELGSNNGDRVMHFHRLAGSYEGPPFINLDPGVDITGIDGSFQLFPPKTVLGAGATIVVGGPPNERIDCPPYRIDGHVDLTFYPPPYALDGTGNAFMFCQHIADEFLHADSTGFVHFGGNANFTFGPLKLDGHFDARFYYPHFTAQAREHGCLGDFICATGDGIISDRGIALCYSVFIGFKKKVFGHTIKIGGTLQIGGGIDWPPPATLVNPVLTVGAIIKSARIWLGSCDFSHYRTVRAAARAAADPAGARSLVVPKNQRAIALAIKGAGGTAPDVEIRGPNGPPIVLPASGPLKGRPDAIGFRSQDGTTYVMVALPDPGRWQIVPRPGSSAIESVTSEVALPEPSVELERRPGKQGRIVYGYKIAPIPGQRVTFLEQVGSTARQLLAASKPSGTLSFFPSSASGTKRSIVAVVTEDGSPRANLTVARFVAPPTRPAKPARVQARRTGTTLKVTWGQAGHAERYTARIRLSDGRSLMFLASTRDRSFTVKDVAPKTTATVRVVGVIGRSVQGPAATARVPVLRRG